MIKLFVEQWKWRCGSNYQRTCESGTHGFYYLFFLLFCKRVVVFMYVLLFLLFSWRLLCHVLPTSYSVLSAFYLAKHIKDERPTSLTSYLEEKTVRIKAETGTHPALTGRDMFFLQLKIFMPQELFKVNPPFSPHTPRTTISESCCF